MGPMRQTSLAAACALALGLAAACGSGSGGTNTGSGADAGGTTLQCSDPNAGLTIPVCAPPPAVAADGTEQILFHATVPVGQTATVTVPAGIAGLTIVEQAASAVPVTIDFKPAQCTQAFRTDNVAVPLRVTDPNGAVVYDDNVFPNDPEAAAAFFASDSPFTGTLTIPNTSAALDAVRASRQLAPGNWSVQVSDFAYECTLQQASGATCTGGSASGSYDVTVLGRPAAAGGGVPAAGALQIAVHFATTATGVTGSPLPEDPALLAQDPDVARLGATLAGLFGAAGVTAQVSFHVLPVAVRNQFANGINVDEAGPCSQLSQLFQSGPQSVPPPPPSAVNVFLVSTLHGGTDPNGNVVVGIDGSIPGPGGIPGTVASGAAVGSGDLRAVPVGNAGACAAAGPDFVNCGDDRTAYILAHEIGHYLGLYHTTESDGASFDPLRDTPQCACRQCSATPQSCGTANAQVGVDRCLSRATGSTCRGGDDLMFWQFSRTSSRGALSPEQGEVMRANPLVH
jgi:hypothetical protein